MGDVRVRPARIPDDLDQICELYAETIEWHAERWPEDYGAGDVRTSVREELSSAGPDDGVHLLVAEVDGNRIVGFAGGHLRSPPNPALARYDGPWMFVNDLVVTDAYRRRGIGAVLMEQLEDLAAQLGAVTLTLMVHGQNQGAANLYQQRGFRPVHLELRKDIGSTT